MKTITFAGLEEETANREFAFELVLRDGDTITFLIFNFMCSRSAFEVEIPALRIGKPKTNYAHCCVRFSAEERDLKVRKMAM